MPRGERDIHHLFNPSVVVGKTERPNYYSDQKITLEDLHHLLQNPQERVRFAPIKIYKAGLQLINKSNLPATQIPEEIIRAKDLQNAETAVKRAWYAQYVFDLISQILNLPPDHLSLGVTKEYIEIHKGEAGRSTIMPTHFRDGAELLIPHDDHMLGLPTENLPKIHIGQHTYIAQNTRLDIGGMMYIGDRVFIARNTHRFGHFHKKEYPGIVRETLIATQTDCSIMIGDDVLVGAGTDIGPLTHYIGQNTIIGQQSTITAPWIGDFSIVVGTNRIVGYQPIQAYFKSEYPEYVDAINMAKIDWEGEIKREWEAHYKEKLANIVEDSDRLGKEKQKILMIGDSVDLNRAASLVISGKSIDIISNNLEAHAFLLQLAQNVKNYKIRCRADSKHYPQTSLELYDYVIDSR
jgi:acetyltransferase-like isoleucine patch superfamily enzyme